jgi:hypothetical protein
MVNRSSYKLQFFREITSADDRDLLLADPPTYRISSTTCCKSAERSVGAFSYYNLT